MSKIVTTKPENEITENSEVDLTSGIHLTGEAPEATLEATTIDGDECLKLADILIQIPLYAVSAGDRIALVTTHKSQADTFIETFNRHKREDALPAVVVEGRFFPMNLAGEGGAR